jgi:hypothetical protein
VLHLVRRRLQRHHAVLQRGRPLHLRHLRGLSRRRRGVRDGCGLLRGPLRGRHVLRRHEGGALRNSGRRKHALLRGPGVRLSPKRVLPGRRRRVLRRQRLLHGGGRVGLPQRPLLRDAHTVCQLPSRPGLLLRVAMPPKPRRDRPVLSADGLGVHGRGQYLLHRPVHEQHVPMKSGSRRVPTLRVGDAVSFRSSPNALLGAQSSNKTRGATQRRCAIRRAPRVVRRVLHRPGHDPAGCQ